MVERERITEGVRGFYNIVWTHYIPRVEEQKRFLSDLVGEENIRGKRVLDAGCGTGVAAVCFKLLGASEVWGVDISEGSLETARKLAEENGADVKFLRANLLEMDLQREFDIIHTFGVLHHTADARRAFDNLIRHLAPSGRLYIALYIKTPATFLHQASRKCLRALLPESLWIPFSRVVRGGPLMVLRKGARRGFGDEGDMLDWFFVPHRTHHTPQEVRGWFREWGMGSELLIEKTGRFKSTSNFLMLGIKGDEKSRVG